MPFTLAHAAAALPLRRILRGNAVFPLLVIGCFVPDIPYFLPEPLARINAHQLPGLVIFGVPCGWAIFLLWQMVLLEPSAALLPRRLADLLLASSAAQTGATRWWPGTLSLLAGSLSHIVWDAFTHKRGLAVHAWPALAQPIVHVGWYTLPSYFILQHVSTAIGMLYLATHIRHRLREPPLDRCAVTAMPRLRVKTRIAVIAVLSLATAVTAWGTFAGGNTARFFIYNFVCGTISAASIVMLIYALTWHVCVRFGHAHSAGASTSAPGKSHRRST